MHFMLQSRNQLRVLSWLWKANKAYCIMFLKSLPAQQVHFLLLTNPTATKELYELAGIQLPMLPPLLKTVPVSADSDAAPVNFDFKDSICQSQRASEDTQSAESSAVTLFCDEDFDQRSRKPHFPILEVLSIEQWQTTIDLLIDRLLSRLNNGPYSTIVIDIPVITKVAPERQASCHSMDWPISYPNVGKWRRKPTWNKLYTTIRDSFRKQWLGPNSGIHSNIAYTIKNTEDAYDNPVLQLLHTITLFKKETKTRLKYSLNQVELLAAVFNTISAHRWPISKKSFVQLLCQCGPYSREVFSLLNRQALLTVTANTSSLDNPMTHFYAAQLLAQAYGEEYKQGDCSERVNDSPT